MLFMVVERFKGCDPRAAYRRLQEEGRHIPDGLTYHGSWIEANFDRCFQLMETDDPALLQQWALAWGDLVELEFVPVVASKEAAEVVKAAL